MACCKDAEACPMHATSDGNDQSRSNVSQADADRCCASGEQGSATPSHTSVASSITIAVLTNPISALLTSLSSARDLDAARPVTDVSSVPTHLLLSVFLI